MSLGVSDGIKENEYGYLRISPDYRPLASGVSLSEGCLPSVEPFIHAMGRVRKPLSLMVYHEHE